MAIFNTLKASSLSEAFEKAKAKINEAVAFAKTKADEAYLNAPTNPSEAFFGTKKLLSKGLKALAGMIVGVISVVFVAYFLLHALIQKALLAWLAAVTLGTFINKTRAKEEQIDLVGNTIKAGYDAKNACVAGFKMAAPIVYSAGEQTGEALMDLALTGANSVCTTLADKAYTNATYANACYAASLARARLHYGVSTAKSTAEGVYGRIFTPKI